MGAPSESRSREALRQEVAAGGGSRALAEAPCFDKAFEIDWGQTGAACLETELRHTVRSLAA